MSNDWFRTVYAWLTSYNPADAIINGDDVTVTFCLEVSCSITNFLKDFLLFWQLGKNSQCLLGIFVFVGDR